MNKYVYRVCLCDGKFCDGVIEVSSDSEEDAYEKVITYVGQRLYSAIPELDIEYYIELERVDGN